MKRHRIKPKWVLKTLLLLVVSFTFSQLSAQEIELSGKITDQQGESLPGVNIFIQGTTRGGISDLDGNYSLNVNTDDIVAF